jgi:hypothetical protein
MPGWGDPKIVDTDLERSLLEVAQQRATENWVSRLVEEIAEFVGLPDGADIEKVEQNISRGGECDLCGYHDDEYSVDIWYFLPGSERLVKDWPGRIEDILNHLLGL